MEVLSFGQPLGAIMQVTYVVEDMDQALTHWTTTLGVGPFFLFKSFKLLDAGIMENQPRSTSIWRSHSAGPCASS